MGRERRVHARVETAFDCELITDRNLWPGQVVDLSYGGARVLGPPGIAEVGDLMRVAMKLPMDAESVTVLGEVRLVTEVDPGRVAYGLRFSQVEPAQRESLTSFIEYLLAGAGVGFRDSPRIARRLEILCRSKQEFRAVMRDISRSGLGLECDQPLLIDEQVTLEIRVEAVDDPLVVTGKVVHTRAVGGDRHHVGLRLGSHSASEKQAIEDFLRKLMSGA
ncbi:MAG: PilZ domain-containing protein [Deltaproteobacteria bacterium]|nr:PilZ domain-containing protein [Deltaproteobacteria bacterium]